MSGDTVWATELDYLKLVSDWAEKAPEGELFYVSHVVIHDTGGTVVGRFYTGDEARFERGAS